MRYARHTIRLLHPAGLQLVTCHGGQAQVPFLGIKTVTPVLWPWTKVVLAAEWKRCMAMLALLQGSAGTLAQAKPSGHS